MQLTNYRYRVLNTSVRTNVKSNTNFFLLDQQIAITDLAISFNNSKPRCLVNNQPPRGYNNYELYLFLIGKLLFYHICTYISLGFHVFLYIAYFAIFSKDQPLKSQ